MVARRPRAAWQTYDAVATWKDKRGYTLSDRVWQNHWRTRAAIDEKMREAIAGRKTVDQTVDELVEFIAPTTGNARYGAWRLVSNETNRAYNLAAHDTARLSVGDERLKYRVSINHPAPDECDDRATRNTGLGPGVYRPADAPIPPVHIGCQCSISPVSGYDRMYNRARQLRAEYGLDEIPAHFTPAQRERWARATGELRERVQLTMRGWHEQTGLVTREQMAYRTSTVREWMNGVRAANGMAPLADGVWTILPRSVRIRPPRPRTDAPALPDPISHADADRYLNDQNESILSDPTWTERETQAVIDYQWESAEINGALREGGAVPGYMQRRIDALDSGMRWETPEGMQVYRGIGDLDDSPMHHLQVGDLFSDPAFVSTSTNREVAHVFAREGSTGGGGQPLMMHITNPRGQRGLWADGAYDEYGSDEWIYPRDTRFRVIDVTTEGEFKVVHMVPEITP